MKTQVSINLDDRTLTALQKLAAREGRSLSSMGAVLLAQKIEDLRGEYQQDQTLASLPKTPRTSTRRWDKACQEQFGN
jgi:predicted transcriptional regulator